MAYMLHRSVFAWSLLLACCASTALGQNKVDELVRERMASSKTPGVTVGIIVDGKATISAYGLADVENGVPAKPDTVYEIGSITKQFTATMVMQLIEEGKIKLEDRVASILPDTPPTWKDVTVKHLLNHTSGIPSYTSLPAFDTFMVQSGAQRDLLKLVSGLPLDFEPGDKWSYNNTGYYLLGLILEKVTGKTYRQALRERITAPLGMLATDLYPASEIVPKRSRGYQLGGGKLENAQYIDMMWPYAAGSILSTVPDLVKWDAAQGSDKLLKPDSWKQLWTPTVLNDKTTNPYGFGWALARVPGSVLIEHNGGIPGFSTQINRYPDKKVTVIVLTNLIGPMVGPLTKEIAALVDPSLAEPKPVAIKDDDPALTARLRKVLESALAGNADRNEFDSRMQGLLWPDRINELKSQLGALGSLKSFELIATESDKDAKKRVYSGEIGPVKLKITFGLDAAGKISGFLIQPAG
jgi:CubicO group peptidase (beta-lactamase class C family)